MKDIFLLSDIWGIFLAMSPYLLFGFAVAGILHVLIPSEKIVALFSKKGLASILKAALFGVPLPLCSCGVIPVAAHMKKNGASNGATLSFLVATPTSGVDSIMATYSLMGPFFAVIRPLAGLLGGILSGILTEQIDSKTNDSVDTDYDENCVICNVNCKTSPHKHTFFEKIRAMFEYAFFDLVNDVAKWLLIGIVAGGIITAVVPEQMFTEYLGNRFVAYAVMLAIAVPLYVCATGSIPIAASLLAKGLTPGAALVFLIAGPATNTAAISFVAGKLGKKALLAYLIAIILTSCAFALITDTMFLSFSLEHAFCHNGEHMLPLWVNTLSAIVLLLLLVRTFFAKILRPKTQTKSMEETMRIFHVSDLDCKHCASAISNQLETVPEIGEFQIDIASKTVVVKGDAPDSAIIAAIVAAGFHLKND